MSLKQLLLKATAENPISLRQAMVDAEVSNALSSVDVLPKVLELHAPSETSRKTEGLGKTLCGIRGTLHAMVTCERCKKRLGKH